MVCRIFGFRRNSCHHGQFRFQSILVYYRLSPSENGIRSVQCLSVVHGTFLEHCTDDGLSKQVGVESSQNVPRFFTTMAAVLLRDKTSTTIPSCSITVNNKEEGCQLIIKHHHRMIDFILVVRSVTSASLNRQYRKRSCIVFASLYGNICTRYYPEHN